MNSPSLQWDISQYELLDFGHGRKLENFGGTVLDRVCPAADGRPKSARVDWRVADLRLDRKGKPVSPSSKTPQDWQVRCAQVVFNLKLTPFGHVGLFPEQVSSWQWLLEHLASGTSSRCRPLRALNLFAYTGGTSLILAMAGLEVVHVDASSPAVAWARWNAAASGFETKPMRWIIDDVRKFVQRELRRGNQYDVIVLDPPSFGHGAGGLRWDLGAHLPSLLDDLTRLVSSDSSLLLLTGHSPQPDAPAVHRLLLDSFSRAGRQWCSTSSQVQRLQLSDRSGRILDAGFTVRGRVQPA